MTVEWVWLNWTQQLWANTIPSFLNKTLHCLWQSPIPAWQWGMCLFPSGNCIHVSNFWDTGVLKHSWQTLKIQPWWTQSLSYSVWFPCSLPSPFWPQLWIPGDQPARSAGGRGVAPTSEGTRVGLGRSCLIYQARTCATLLLGTEARKCYYKKEGLMVSLGRVLSQQRCLG